MHSEGLLVSRRFRSTPVAALATAGWTCAIAGSLVALAVRLAAGVPMADNRFHFGDASAAAMVVLHVTFATVGAIVAARRPGNPVGWLLLAAGIGYALCIASATYVSARIADGSGSAAAPRRSVGTGPAAGRGGHDVVGDPGLETVTSR